MTAVLLILCIILLSVSLIRERDRKSHMQQHIDQTFIYHFSLLNQNQITLALNPDFTDEEKEYYQLEITKSGALISSLFSTTSFREDKGLNVIVGLLDQSTGLDAINQLTMTQELNQVLSDIQVNQFSDREANEKALNLLKECISS